MTERVWLDGVLPAVATDHWALLTTGHGAALAARRMLALPADTRSPTPLLDALLADGVSAAPAFALVGLLGDRLTVFLRGPFAMRAEHTHRGEPVRADGHGVHGWRELTLTGVERAWVLQSPAITRTDGALRAAPVEAGPTTASGIAMRATRGLTGRVPAAGRRSDRSLPVGGAPRMLELPDGRRVHIRGELLIGRGPRTGPLPPDRLPVLVALEGAPRELSRTHLRVRQDGDLVTLEDLGGAGGTALRTGTGGPQRLRAAEPVTVQAGQTAELPGGLRIRFLGEA